MQIPKLDKKTTINRNSARSRKEDFREKDKEDSSWTGWKTSSNLLWMLIIYLTIKKIINPHNKSPNSSKIKVN